MTHEDISQNIERLEAVEDKLGISLNALSAFLIDSNYLRCCGEVHLSGGKTTLASNIAIIAAAYDKQGRVVENQKRTINSEEFYAFQTFEMELNVENAQVAKIRIYASRPN